MEVNFQGNKDIILVQEQKVSVNKLTINRMVDLPAQKKVVVFVKEIPKPIVLWEGDAVHSATVCEPPLPFFLALRLCI